MGRGYKNFASLHLLTHHNTTSKWKCIWGWAHLNVISSPRREQVKLHLLPLQTVHQLILVISHCTHYLVGMATASLQLEKRPKYNTGPPSWRPNNLQWSQNHPAKYPAPERACCLTWGAGGGWDGSGPLCARWDCFSSHSTACDQPAICWGQPAISNTQGLLSTQHKHNNKLR